VYLTKKKMLNYKHLLQQSGFNVKLLPYQLLGSKAIDYIIEPETEHNNPMHFN
jgi:hypothetical protein